MSRPGLETVDFNVHGVIGIRAVDASERDRAVVRRQIGPLEGQLDREPDIVLRFVDRVEVGSRVRFVGLDDVAYTDEALVVLRGRHQAPTRTRIPVDRIGDPCEIVCEHGLSAVPYLVAIINLTAVARGYVPVHAAAFLYEGNGILVTGWSKGGKTETLLGFMALGAEYVADEWLYVDPTSSTMTGLPEPMRIWDWQLRAMPAFGVHVSARRRAGLRSLRAVTELMRRTDDVLRGSTAAGRTLRRARPLLERQLSVQVPPERLFPGRTLARAPIDRIVFVVSADRPDIDVAPVDAERVALRAAISADHERLDLEALHLKSRFAFPVASNPWLERASALGRERLVAAFRDRPAIMVEHPYPPDIPALAREIEPHLR